MRRRDLLLGSMAVGGAWTFGLRALAQEADREPADPSRLTPEERRHAPVLVMPRAIHAGRAFDLVIQVGVEPHGMTPAHHIERVELLRGAERVFSVELGPSVAFPVVRVPVVLTGNTVLSARAVCNLHGAWRTRRMIEVR
jgi:superoxide reductase